MPEAATSPRLVRQDCEDPNIDIRINFLPMLRRTIRGVKDSVATVMPVTCRKIFGINDVSPTSLCTDHTSDLLKRCVVHEVSECCKEDDTTTIASHGDSQPKVVKDAANQLQSRRAAVLRHLASGGFAAGGQLEQLSDQQIMLRTSRRTRRITTPTRIDCNILYTSLRDVVPEDFQYFRSGTDDADIPSPQGQSISIEDTEDTGVTGFHWASESSFSCSSVQGEPSSGSDDHMSTSASCMESESDISQASSSKVSYHDSFPKKTVPSVSPSLADAESVAATHGRRTSAEIDMRLEGRLLCL